MSDKPILTVEQVREAIHKTDLMHWNTENSTMQLFVVLKALIAPLLAEARYEEHMLCCPLCKPRTVGPSTTDCERRAQLDALNVPKTAVGGLTGIALLAPAGSLNSKDRPLRRRTEGSCERHVKYRRTSVLSYFGGDRGICGNR